MKIFILFLLSLILVVGVYLWENGKETHEIRTEIDIVAPPEKVWAVLSDINSWYEWNPIVNHSTGDSLLGSTLSITMIGEKDHQDVPKYHPIITHLDAPNYFHWRAVMMAGFVMANDKVFELEATSTGTRLVHKELFKGMIVPIFRNKFDKNVPLMLNAMNQALKEQAETIE